MIQTIQLFSGITLRCFPDRRFKHGCLSIQAVRPMCRREAAMNALLPAVLLRGSRSCPDLRSITLRLDDLYGASTGTLVRRVGDYQTTGLYAGFTEDRFAMDGDRILEPLAEFMGQLLLDPVPEAGVFRRDYVESEKKNLVSVIESQLNDKRAYAMEHLMRRMCREDSFGIPRLGEKADVEAIEAETLYRHYRKLLRESRIDIFYVGAAPAAQVEGLMRRLFGPLEREYVPLPAQTPFRSAPGGRGTKQMEIRQAKLCMGFVTPVTIRDPEFVTMQLLNMVFGGEMTSKLFVNIREKQSLCYAIGSGYQGTKGILTVSAGIDSAMEETVRGAVLEQLEACRRGDISEAELTAAKQALGSTLRATHDSPGAIESYYASGALSGLGLDPAAYLEAVEAVTVAQLQEVARTLELHSEFFLKGVGQ